MNVPGLSICAVTAPFKAVMILLTSASPRPEWTVASERDSSARQKLSSTFETCSAVSLQFKKKKPARSHGYRLESEIACQLSRYDALHSTKPLYILHN